MDKISIPEQDVVRLDDFAPDVVGIRILLVNAYGVTGAAGEWVLVDTGLPRSEDRILAWAAHTFGPSKPSAIILTHGHFDHAGSAEELASHWNVPVFAHPLELPYLNGTAPDPPPDPTVGGGIMSLMSRLFPRDPVDLTEWLEPPRVATFRTRCCPRT